MSKLEPEVWEQCLVCKEHFKVRRGLIINEPRVCKDCRELQE